MQKNRKTSLLSIFSFLFFSSCSLVGVQTEERPKYKVLIKEGNFEVREYAPYIVAETTVEGNFNNSSRESFKILAGYIFGKNKAKTKLSMTSPVKMEQDSVKIAMTSPVKMNQSEGKYTMGFSMPSDYTLDQLPEPLDNRVKLKVVKTKVLASHKFSWFSSQSKNDKKAEELNLWLKKHPNYKRKKNYSYAGYNPPWTLPFFRLNEVHIELLNQ